MLGIVLGVLAREKSEKDQRDLPIITHNSFNI